MRSSFANHSMRSSHLLPIGLLLLLSACGGDPSASDRSPSLVIGEGERASVAVLHQMPTPNELFVQVRGLSGPGDRRYLNPASNADRYATLRSRAINFGVYSTDLVYASTFELNVEVARYYLATKKLAEALGLSSVFTDAEFIRLESNLTRGDSLEIISNEVYMRAYEKLEEAEMGPVLTLVLIGGWVESMHLLMMHGEGEKPAEARRRVAEQRSTLEHLIALSDEQAADPDVAELRLRLTRILDIYDTMNVHRKPHASKSTSGRMVLGEDIVAELSDERYQAIKEAMATLRTELTRTEDKP